MEQAEDGSPEDEVPVGSECWGMSVIAAGTLSLFIVL